MKRLIVSLLLVAAMAGPAAAGVFVFETVDEFERQGDRLIVRGILQGQTEGTELVLRWLTQPTELTASCERMALMAMARPGRYFLRVTTDTRGNVEVFEYCRLLRR